MEKKQSRLEGDLPPLAVLCSGGVDSAVLLGNQLSTYPFVYPLYIRTGSYWEGAELAHLDRFLEAIQCHSLKPLTILSQPVADLYGSHWSLTGKHVPGANSPDEAVYLPGRNVLLLAKALLWCHLHHVPEIALAPLKANPFPDAEPAFFEAFSAVVNMAVEGNIRILRPYASLSKREVIQRGKGLPLQHTFSCICPINGQHCGRCNKCAERQNAFREAEILDPTTYEERATCSG